MNFFNIFIDFLLGTLSTAGFALILNIPRRHVFPCSIVGGLSSALYYLMMDTGSAKAAAAFCAGLSIVLLGEICSRLFKEARTIFTIPSIMPLVPGAGIYYTMCKIIDGNYSQAVVLASETFFVAGAIALAILVGGSIFKIITSLKI